MLRNVLLVPLAALLALTTAHAQTQTGSVGIGTTAPDASAALDIVSSSKGALLPRLTQAARLALGTGSAPAPAAGLLVYQTDGSKPGFWYNSGTSAAPAWVRLTDSAGLSYDPATGLLVGPGPTAVVNAPSGTATSSSDLLVFVSINAAIPAEHDGMVYRAADLLAAGYRAGPISSVGFMVTNKTSGTNAFQGFTIRLANTAQAAATATFLPGATTVFTGNVTTTAGLNTFALATPFTWDGTSNLYVETCCNNSAPIGSDNVAYYTTAYQSLTYADGANACATTTGSTVAELPVLYLSQPGSYTLPAGPGTAGQVLTQQTNGAVAFQTPPWTQNGASIYPSLLSSNVGIGTSSPAQLLDVNGTVRIARAIVGNGADLGSAVGVGVRADGGLNIGQNTTGNNIYIGYLSGLSNTTGGSNIFNGFVSGLSNTTGSHNLFSGTNSGFYNTTGNNNLFAGTYTGTNNTTGSNNQFLGHFSGLGNTTGSNNAFVGYFSGQNNATGSNITALGANSGPASGNLTNATAIGANVSLTQSNTVVLGNGANVGIGTSAPAAKLDIQGGADDNGGGPTALSFQWRNGGYRHFVRSRHNGNVSGAGNDLDFYLNNGTTAAGSSAPGAGNVQVLTLESNNGQPRAGIGTTAPTQALDVRGNLRLGNDNNGALGFGSAIEFVGPGVNTDVLGLYRANVTNNFTELRMVLGDDAGGINNDKFVLGTTGAFNGPDQLLSGSFTPQFTIISNGNVGIGNAAVSPTAALDVAGNVRVRGLTTAGVVTTDASGNLSSNSGSGSFILNQTSTDQAGGFRISGNGYIGSGLGIGTTAPATTLDVRTADGSAAITVGSTANTDGAVYFGNSNHGVKRNYSNGNDVGLYTTAANLYLSANGPSTSQFVLLNDGSVGIGTTPGAKLHVAGNMKIDGTNTLEFGAGIAGKEVSAGKIGYRTFSTDALDIVGAGTGSNRVIRFYAENGAGFNGAVNAQSFNTNSDARFKTHVRPIGAALASVLALRGVRYDWNALGIRRGGKAGAGQVGLIAQELEKVYPELVFTDADGYKSVNYAQLAPVLIEALKEQQQQIEALKARAASAEATHATDHADLQTLKAQLARLLGEQPTAQAPVLK